MSLELEAKKTALVVIDLEPAIISRKLAPHSADDVVKHARLLADKLRTAGGHVVFVHVLMNEMRQVTNDVSMPKPPAPLPAEATNVVPETGIQPTDTLIAKRTWGAFHGTGLEETLKGHGIETIIMAGIATNMGVESTARAAYDAGFQLVFAEDAMSTMHKEWHEFSIKNLFPIMGRVRSTEEIISAL